MYFKTHFLFSAVSIGFVDEALQCLLNISCYQRNAFLNGWLSRLNDGRRNSRQKRNSIYGLIQQSRQVVEELAAENKTLDFDGYEI